jgi:hypothetical protein
MTSHPLRIQRKRTSGFRLPAGTICVTRPGRFGSPFESAASFAVWLETGDVASDLLKPMTPEELGERRRWILANLDSLRGRTIACFCPPEKQCHADVLATLANEKSLTSGN